MLTTGEVGKRLGIHPNTVRNWRRKGILTPAQRLPSGQARYSPEDVDRVRREMRQDQPDE